jgi:cyclic lactone autoinducer peptide
MKSIFSVLAALGMKSAVKASDTASILGCYQPKEPAALNNQKKQ